MLSRRHLLKLGAGTLVATAFPGISQAAGLYTSRIGATDWSLGHKQHIDAFKVGRQIGLEGIQVSFSTPGSEFDLRDPKVRELYYETVQSSGIRLASLGMGILNSRPYASDPETDAWVSEVIDVMAAMKEENPREAPNVCLLAFFGKGDINGQPELMESVIQKLKKVMPKAEEKEVIFGIESLLSGEDHLKIIDAVGSPNLQVYYDSANSARMGYDIYQEVKDIGGERICQVHCKENDRQLLGEGAIDFAKWRDSLAEAKYEGWLIIEGSTPKDVEIVDAYLQNHAFLDRTFRH